MYFKIEQIENELFCSKFIIVDSDNNKLGNVVLNGSMSSIEANIEINYLGNNICLKFGYNSLKEKLKATFSNGIFRPYKVVINNDKAGRIGTKYLSEGLFNKIAFKELVLNDIKYENYCYGLGEKGKIYSIYSNNIQISEIHKNSEIIDGLHNYEIKCIESKYIIPTLIQCMYIYVFTDYIPGQKVIKGKQINIVTTKSKLLESKYNPNFWNS